MPQLRRCNTDLSHGALPRDPKKRHLDSSTIIADDDQKLRHELSASINARRNLEKMFSSLGKEKEIIAAELARKVHELREAEELVEDLRTQNEALLEKVRASALASPRHKTKGESTQFVTELQERNNALSEQLLKAIDEYWVMERRARDLQDDNARFVARVAEIAVVGFGIVRRLRVEMEGGGSERVVVEELEALEQMLVGLQRKLVAVGVGPWA